MRLTILIFLFFSSLAYAQCQPLPKGLTNEEKENLSQYYRDVIKTSVERSDPAPSRPRVPAEWEEMQGIVIAWDNYFKDLQQEIVRHAKEEGMVYIVTDDKSQVENVLATANIDITENITFVEGNYNSLWIRDYGPNSVYINDVDSLVFVDWIYNRPRYEDDKVPTLVGNLMDIDVINMDTKPYDLVHTGGNFMSNGAGQGFSSELVLEENAQGGNFNKSEHDEDDVDSLMNAYMGINDYILMEELPYDYIHHIDMHMKIVDEENIIVGEYPEGISDGPQIEANLQYIMNNYRTKYGDPYKIHRIPMPPDAEGKYPVNNGDYRTYANALIFNKLVLVPIYNISRDQEALDIWRSVLPGHKVVGIDCNEIIRLSGAIHCITKEIAVGDPIWIDHKPLTAAEETSHDYIITTTIKSKIPVDEVLVYYSGDNGDSYDSFPLTYTGDNQWTGDFKDYISTADTIIYYIEAANEAGKKVEKPLTGSRGGGWKITPQVQVSVSEVSSGDEIIGPPYPNPASTITAIPINIISKAHVRAVLYDDTGRLIQVIHDGEWLPSRKHIFFNAGDHKSGNYYIEIIVNKKHFTRRIVIK